MKRFDKIGNDVVRAAGADLRALDSADVPLDPLAVLDEYTRNKWPNYGLVHLLRYIGKPIPDLQSRARMLRPSYDYEPVTPVGKLAIAYDDTLHGRQDSRFGFRQNTCSNAEPYFSASLDWDNSKVPGERRSIVFVDDDSRPVAYMKNTGRQDAIVVAEHRFFTGLPIGTIMMFVHDQQAVRNTANSNIAVVPIEAVETGSILRPSTFCLEPSYVASTNYLPTENPHAAPDGTSYSTIAMTQTIDDIRREVEKVASAAGIC